MKPIAVIWDMNGVIIDDMEYHFLAFKAFMKELGHEVTRDYFLEVAVGASPYQVFSDCLPRIGNPVTVNEAARRKTELYFQLIKGKMVMLPGCRELIIDLNKRGFRQAIASGGTRIEVDRIMEEFGISKYFGATIACEDVTKGKPDPEPWLAATGRLGVEPENCVIVEDGEFGIRGAKAAGMKAIGIVSGVPREQLAAADLIVESLKEVDAERVMSLLAADQKADAVRMVK